MKTKSHVAFFCVFRWPFTFFVFNKLFALNRTMQIRKKWARDSSPSINSIFLLVWKKKIIDRHYIHYSYERHVMIIWISLHFLNYVLWIFFILFYFFFSTEWSSLNWLFTWIAFHRWYRNQLKKRQLNRNIYELKLKKKKFKIWCSCTSNQKKIWDHQKIKSDEILYMNERVCVFGCAFEPWILKIYKQERNRINYHEENCKNGTFSLRCLK